jgi:ankyrin repeat protein
VKEKNDVVKFAVILRLFLITKKPIINNEKSIINNFYENLINIEIFNEKYFNIVKYFNKSDITINDTELLWKACRNNNTILFDKIIDIPGLNVNVDISLKYAIINGNYHMVNELIKKGANVNYINGENPIIFDVIRYASKNVDGYEIFKLMMQTGVDINTIMLTNGLTLLMYACYMENLDIVEYLLTDGADINLKNKNGHNILRYIFSLKNTPENMEIIKRIMSHDVSGIINEKIDDLPPFIYILKHKLFNKIPLLIKKGINIIVKDDGDKSSLMYAIESENIEIIKMLIEKGADVHSSDNLGMIPFIFAIQSKNDEIIKLLLRNFGKRIQINISDTGSKTPLMYAIESENIKLINYLLINGAEINNADIYGMTPLIYAIKSKNNRIIKMLIDKDAEINVADVDSMSPLSYAILNDIDIEIIKLLIERSNIEIINLKDSNNNSPLLHAIKKSNYEIARILFETVTDMYMLDKNGNTLLMTFVEISDDLNMIKLILYHTIEHPNITNNNGLTLFDIVIRKKPINIDIIKYLMDTDVIIIDRVKLEKIVYLDNFELFKLCLENYLENHKDYDPNDLYNVISWCIYNNWLDHIKLLCFHKINFNISNQYNKMSVLSSLLNDNYKLINEFDKNIETINLLLECGVDINLVDDNSMTTIGYIFINSKEISTDDTENIEKFKEYVKLFCYHGAKLSLVDPELIDHRIIDETCAQ